MTDVTSSDITSSSETMKVAESQLRLTVLHVCTSCRAKGAPREPMEQRLGFKLYQQLEKDVQASCLNQVVKVKPTNCLSLCPRPCAIAVSSSGSWSYLFGEQGLNDNTSEILECLALYVKSKDGVMLREQRPKSLRASILGRVPPTLGNLG